VGDGDLRVLPGPARFLQAARYGDPERGGDVMSLAEMFELFGYYSEIEVVYDDGARFLTHAWGTTWCLTDDDLPF